MSERSEYRPGEFCWVDLVTSDIEGAVKFYGDLIGWDYEAALPAEESGGYGLFLYTGKRAAGVGPLPADGGHSAWLGYICVANADETVAKIEQAGGSVMMGPLDLPGGAGRIAVCRDTEGAFFAILQPGTTKGAELVNEIGAWTWNQLASRDLDAAKRFYGEVFGWTLEPSPEAPPDSPYEMWQVEGQEWEEGLAGAMAMGDEMPAETPPHWMVYFCVEDAAKAVEQAKGSGGSVMLGPLRIPVGELAVISDPQTAAFGLIEPDYPEDR